MDCDVCKLRSSVNYCAVCQKLVCEVCGVGCEECGKVLCPEHAEKSRSGKSFCAACLEARQLRKKARKEEEERREDLEDSSFAGLEAAEHGAKEKEEPDEDRPILTASGYRPKPFWWRSIFTTGMGGLVSMGASRYPGVAAVLQPWLSIVIGCVACLSIVHAASGLRYDDRKWTWFLNFLAMALAIGLLLFIYNGFHFGEVPE